MILKKLYIEVKIIQIKMGNNINKKSFYMHIKLIGSNIEKFYAEFKKSIFLRNIIKFWDIDKLEDSAILDQLNKYFDYLNEIKNNMKVEEDKSDNLREVLILKLNNIFDPEVNILLTKMNELSETHYMPLVLLLTVNKANQKLIIDTEKYDNIDPRLIFEANYTEHPEKMEEEIYLKLLRLCSIHNELGDIFSVGKGNNEESYDLIEKNFPFNMNIACIGRFGQGKSTGVNALLKEYKAKESNKGSSQTKNLTFYQVKNNPIRILDIPGFENDQTVNDAKEKLKKCGVKINEIKDKIHFILYFLNYSEKRAFMKLELPIIEEITNHKSSKIIYVITHSKPNMTEKIKNKIFERINTGIKGITKDSPISDKIEKMFKANDNNVVFVNFHKNELNDEEPFGNKELFKKIYDFFIQSEDYTNSLKQLNKENIEQKAKKLRAQAEETLLYNKIWGGAVGVIPFVDWALQKYVIKKNAVKKVGQIFGIDAKFIDDENVKKEKNKKKEDNEGYVYEIDGDKALEESTEYKTVNSIKCTTEMGSLTSGGISLGVSTAQAINVANLTAKATQLGAEASELAANAAMLAAKAKDVNIFMKGWYFITGTTSAASKMAASAAAEAAAAAQKAASAAQSAAAAGSSTLVKFAGYGFLGFGIVLGVGLGGYFTHKFCEELLDKFEDYYKNNADKIINSYKNAAEYFLLKNEN